MVLLYLATFSDVAYELSRALLRFASVLFLAYVLTAVIVLVVTWRPKGRTPVLTVREVTAARVSRQAELPAGSSLHPGEPLPVSNLKKVPDIRWKEVHR